MSPVSRPPASEARERKKMTKKKEVNPSRSQATNKDNKSAEKTRVNIEPKNNRIRLEKRRYVKSLSI